MFSPEGIEAYVRPATYFVPPRTMASFFEIMKYAQLKGELAIGYCVNGNLQPVLNPEKSLPICWSEKDTIVVLAAD